MRLVTVLLVLGTGLASADTFLIKSTNGGRTWTDIDPGPPHQVLYWFRVDPATPILYALTQRDVRAEGQLLVSADRGQTWHAQQNFPPDVSWGIRAAEPVSPDTLYLAYEQPAVTPQKAVEIVRVTAGGRVVEQYRAQDLAIGPGAYLIDLAADPAEPSGLYALITNEYHGDLYADFEALWRSENGGRNWRRLEPPVSANCTYPEFRIDPSGSPMYLHCGSDFFKSMDRGDSWTRTTGPDGGRIWNLEIGAGAPGTLYGVRSEDVWKSTDAGETWQRAGSLPGVWRLQAHPTNPSVIFAAGSHGILKSEDGGETWTTLLAAQLEHPWLLGIRVDPRTPDTLYGVNSPQRLELRLHDRQTFLRNLVGEKQVAPRSLVSIYGRDLARETRVADSTPLPHSLGGAGVLFNDQPAPLLLVSPARSTLRCRSAWRQSQRHFRRRPA